MAAEEINKAAGRNFARLIISDNPTALKDLRDAAADRILRDRGGSHGY